MMTLDKFTEIVETYGTLAEQWPVADKSDCEQLLAHSLPAQNMLRQQAELNKLLGQIAVPDFPDLEDRILNQSLPPRKPALLDQLFEWLLPSGDLGRRIWRPAAAACLPLVFGMLIGNFFSFGITAEEDGFAYWDDELYVLSLSDYSENLF